MTTIQLSQLGNLFNDNVSSVLFSVLVGGGTAAMWIRSKLSKSSLESTKDNIEEHLLEHLEHERDVLKADNERMLQRLIKVDGEKNLAVSKVSSLTVEVELLRNRVQSLEALVTKLGDKLDIATTKMHELAMENVILKAKN